MQKINMVDNETPKKLPATKKSPATPVKTPQKTTPNPSQAKVPVKKPHVSPPQTAVATGKAPVKATPSKVIPNKAPTNGNGPVVKANTPAKTPEIGKATPQPKKAISDSAAKATGDGLPGRRKPIPPEVLPSRKKPAQVSTDKKSDSATGTGMLEKVRHI